MKQIRRIRNIGIIAHIDAGKTTTTERLIYYSGREHRHGDVDNGTTVTDYDPEEANRGITIYSAATTVEWQEHTINIIDTPGHVDFTAEVERALRVLDGAVTILDGVAGVQAQTETVWRQANRYGVPRLIFVNKLDRAGADFEQVLEMVRQKLRGVAVPVTEPDESGPGFSRVLDLLSGEWLSFSAEDEGKTVLREPASGADRSRVREGRARLVEALADHHDSVLVEQVVERHLLEGAVPTEDLVAALREATLANHLLPAYAGSALRNRGVQPLMDGIVQLLPCPLDCPPQVGVHPKTGEEESRPPKPSAPFSALAFKTVSEPSVDLTFIRVYSGSVKGRVQVLNATRNKTERIGPIYYRMHGRHRSEVRELMPGSIAVLAGLRFTSTGDTLCAVERPLVYETITFPETVLAMTIEPSSAAGRGKLVDALSRLARDDPTFRVGEDPETGEMVIGGMGELHLEIIKHRLLRDFNVEARVGQPRVSYRESVRLTGRGRHEHEQIVGDRRRYFARVELELAPDPGTRAVRVAFAASLEEQLPRAMRDVLVETIQGCAGGGVQLGYPFIDLHVEVRAASSEGADSSEAAYAAAAAGAFSEACEALGQVGGLAILEPLMELEVLVPEAYLGNVINDLNGRRALVTEMGGDQDMRVVRGKVPLREMFNYTTDLRSMTHGKATHVMEPLEYAPLPEELQRQLLGIG